MPKKPYDPLSWVPSVAALETSVQKTEETLRRLRVLLDTARRIESSPQNGAANRRKGGEHA